MVTPSQSPGPCQVVNTAVMFRQSQESGKTAVSESGHWSAECSQNNGVTRIESDKSLRTGVEEEQFSWEDCQ